MCNRIRDSHLANGRNVKAIKMLDLSDNTTVLLLADVLHQAQLRGDTHGRAGSKAEPLGDSLAAFFDWVDPQGESLGGKDD